MNAKILISFSLLALPQLATAADSQWLLEQSTLTYHVSHPLHPDRRRQPCRPRQRAFVTKDNAIS